MRFLNSSAIAAVVAAIDTNALYNSSVGDAGFATLAELGEAAAPGAIPTSREGKLL